MLPNIYKRIPYKVTIIGDLNTYNYYSDKGYSPLTDWRHFYIDINLRKQLEDELFHNHYGVDTVVINDRYYKYCFEHAYMKACEECALPILSYSAANISHIVSRGSNRGMAIDTRNYNLLCSNCHNIYESGSRNDMKIYELTNIVRDILYFDYEQKKAPRLGL